MTNEERKNAIFRQVVDEIIGERNYQRRRWTPEEGQHDDRQRTPLEWLAILDIYLGKAAKETSLYQGEAFELAKFKKRMIQISAIAMAAVENLSLTTETPESSNSPQ